MPAGRAGPLAASAALATCFVAVLSSGARAQELAPPQARPLFVSAQLPERGELTLQLAGGKPFSSASVDYGLFQALTVGLVYDLATTGFSRAGARLRVRALRLGRAELGLRLALSAVLPGPGSGYGARAIARTGDGELGLQLSYALLSSLAIFGEGAVLGETDFGRARTAAFLEAGAGAEWAVVSPLSVIGRYGGIKGARGSAQTFALGLGAHF